MICYRTVCRLSAKGDCVYSPARASIFREAAQPTPRAEVTRELTRNFQKGDTPIGVTVKFSMKPKLSSVQSR